MPLSVQQNTKTRVWDDVGPKIISVLQKAGVESDLDALAEEIFEQMWPDIFKEMGSQVQSAQDNLVGVAVQRNFSR